MTINQTGIDGHAKADASGTRETQKFLDFEKDEDRVRLICGLPQVSDRLKSLIMGADTLSLAEGVRDGALSIVDPSTEQLMEVMKCSKRTVYYAIEEAEEEAKRGRCPYIKVSRNRGRRDLLTVNFRPIIEHSRPPAKGPERRCNPTVAQVQSDPVAQVQSCKVAQVQSTSS